MAAPPPYPGQPQAPAAYPPGYVAPQPVYYPAPQQPVMMYPPPMQQSSNNVTVVNAGAPASHTVVVERRGVNHLLHFCITLFFWPWIIVWIILCITEG
ncbi:hypothetical protein PoB_005347000 [Plakobranchus ocellatus]|uniref:Uncharacterized protein n=1 Tax=Plakobranchus ocellatus TaxID=259542 RepID=A0AAV4C2Q8_9GAST|nr:hypothetical protein PoB_005347000 [Plakobranchus ocellatus]